MSWLIPGLYFLAGAFVGFVIGCLVDSEEMTGPRRHPKWYRPMQGARTEPKGYYYPPSKEWRPTDRELDRELGRFFAPGNGGAKG